MKPLLLTLLAVVLLFAPVLLGLPDLPDAAVGALFIVAAGYGLFEVWAEREGWVRNLAPTALAVPFLLWMYSLSTYGPASDTPRIGDVAPDIEAVRVRDGAVFRLAAQRGRGALLVFFRGPW